MGAFVHSGWSCVCYATTAEATRRAALLAMLSYDPMATRAVSTPKPGPSPKPNQGRMQDLGRVPNLAGGVPNPNPNQAMRAKHGRMQGGPLEPLLLLTQEGYIGEIWGDMGRCREM